MARRIRANPADVAPSRGGPCPLTRELASLDSARSLHRTAPFTNAGRVSLRHQRSGFSFGLATFGSSSPDVVAAAATMQKRDQRLR